MIGRCRICDQPVSQLDMVDHVRTWHPYEARYYDWHGEYP